MMQKNNSISCSVNECAHHANGENYCTLDKINVTKCSSKSCCCADTECDSFKSK